MDHIYSYLDEVWADKPLVVTEEESRIDDIMSAYVGGKENVSGNEIQGYNKTSYYGFNNVFDNDIVTMTKKEEEAKPTVCAIPQEQRPETIIQDVVETFSSQETPQKYSELMIFALSGVLLIFLFDKLVHLGRQLKR
jgi:hypothetical protein